GRGRHRRLDRLGTRLWPRAGVLVARCDAAGGATFAPLADALRAALGLDEEADGAAVRAAVEALRPEDESARIADGVGALLAGHPAAQEETFFVIRRLLAALATTRPVLLAIDAVQWAETLLLDLTEHLVEWGPRVPPLAALTGG